MVVKENFTQLFLVIRLFTVSYLFLLRWGFDLIVTSLPFTDFHFPCCWWRNSSILLGAEVPRFQARFQDGERANDHSIVCPSRAQSKCSNSGWVKFLWSALIKVTDGVYWAFTYSQRCAQCITCIVSLSFTWWVLFCSSFSTWTEAEKMVPPCARSLVVPMLLNQNSNLVVILSLPITTPWHVLTQASARLVSACSASPPAPPLAGSLSLFRVQRKVLSQRDSP